MLTTENFILKYYFRLSIGVLVCGLIYWLCLKLGDLFYVVYQGVARHYNEHENTGALEDSNHPLLNQGNRIRETVFTNQNHNADRAIDNDNYTSRSASSSTISEHGRSTSHFAGPSTSQSAGPSTSQSAGPSTSQQVGPSYTQSGASDSAGTTQTTFIVNATIEPLDETAIDVNATIKPTITSTPKANPQELENLDETPVVRGPDTVAESNETPTTRRRRGRTTPNIRKTGSPPRKQPNRGCKKQINYKC